MELLYDSGDDFLVFAFLVQGKLRLWRHMKGTLRLSEVAQVFGVGGPMYAS